MSDHDLLQRYARTGDQAAFTELVARHLNLVYSAARRQVSPPHLAEDVTQSVFLDLARRARDFPSGQPLAPWLHVVTRRTSIDLIRRESRRQAREQTAQEIAAMQTPDSTWSHIEPHLDEAVAALSASDRTAIVLRFFENKNLREIGAALGTNEDAAQKRVSRALDQLRTRLLRRGLTLTAATLATDLSAHAILTAPVSLGASISAAALSATGTAVAGAVAMTTLQKSLAFSVLALVFGAGIYEATLFARRNSELSALTRHEFDLAAQLARVRAQQRAVDSRLKSVDAQIDTLLAETLSSVSPEDAALEAQIKAWYANLDRLKSVLKERPEFSIPELALLPSDAWFDIATKSDLTTDSGLRSALAELRIQSAVLFGAKLGPAFHAFVQAHQGAFPDQISQLLPYLKGSVEPSWLDRYTLVNSALVSTLPAGAHPNEFIAVKSHIDQAYDKNLLIGTIGVFSFDDGDAGSNWSKISTHTNVVGASLSTDPARSLSLLLRQFYKNQKRSTAP
jgi:RNA polymerase sigma factor (sigma-70 family)